MIELVVYGAEQLCPSCMNSPSSKDTFEWLKAAVARKFPDQPVVLTYVDIYSPPNDPVKHQFAQKVIEEEMFYPVVVLGTEVVGEGSPRLKPIFTVLESYGYKSC